MSLNLYLLLSISLSNEQAMAQASVLTDNEYRRVFRIIETTRHADRNRLAFMLSRHAGMRVGEIAALKIGDIANQFGEARREIKLSSDQTKGNRSRVVILSDKVRKEIVGYLTQYRCPDPEKPLIRSQRGGPFSSLTLCMLFREIYEAAGIRTSSHSGRRTFATHLNAKGVGMRTIQKLMGHRHISTTALYCEVSEEVMRNAVELV